MIAVAKGERLTNPTLSRKGFGAGVGNPLVSLICLSPFGDTGDIIGEVILMKPGGFVAFSGFGATGAVGVVHLLEEGVILRLMDGGVGHDGRKRGGESDETEGPNPVVDLRENEETNA